jgi:hypothetical protein
MDIKVLGTGCANCKNTLKLIEEVALEKGVAVQLEKVEDIQSIMGYGVLSTPAVVTRLLVGWPLLPCLSEVAVAAAAVPEQLVISFASGSPSGGRWLQRVGRKSWRLLAGAFRRMAHVGGRHTAEGAIKPLFRPTRASARCGLLLERWNGLAKSTFALILCMQNQNL